MRDRLLRIASDSDPRRRFKPRSQLRPAECRRRTRERSLRARASNGARSPSLYRPRIAKWTLRRLRIRANPVTPRGIYLGSLEIVSPRRNVEAETSKAAEAAILLYFGQIDEEIREGLNSFFTRGRLSSPLPPPSSSRLCHVRVSAEFRCCQSLRASSRCFR